MGCFSLSHCFVDHHGTTLAQEIGFGQFWLEWTNNHEFHFVQRQSLAVLDVLLHVCIRQTFFIQNVLWCIHRERFSQHVCSLEISVYRNTGRPETKTTRTAYFSCQFSIDHFYSINQEAHPNTTHRKPPPSPLALPAALWPMAFSYWPCVARQKGLLTLLTGTAKESAQDALAKNPSDRDGWPATFSLQWLVIMRGVNGVQFSSSLEPSVWHSLQAIKSIIFSVKSQDLEGGSCNGLPHSNMYDGHFYS